jgi:hypothetical protein
MSHGRILAGSAGSGQQKTGAKKGAGLSKTNSD